jgi:hypothetical protein
MSRHLLGVLESSVVFQANRDAGCPPGVTFDNTLGLGGRKREKLNAPVVDPKQTFGTVAKAVQFLGQRRGARTHYRILTAWGRRSPSVVTGKQTLTPAQYSNPATAPPELEWLANEE